MRAMLFDACANLSHPPGTIAHSPVGEVHCECACHVANPTSPLPDWMPTPEELALWEQWFKLGEYSLLIVPYRRLIRAVSWLLEERENR